MNSIFYIYKSFRDILALWLQALSMILKGPYRSREILFHLESMGVQSLPIIVISTAFAGLVMTGEIAYHMNLAMNTVEMIPGFSGQFVFREVGIAIPALLLVSKVGASTTAEVSSMKVTEQIDALKLLRIDPLSYLVFPRFLASVIIFPCLTIFSIVITIACALAMATLSYRFMFMEYLNSMLQFLSFKDLFAALVKSVSFGSIVPVISCYFGFQCRSGAEGVGLATTQSVVASTITVIGLDFILTYLLSSLFV